MNPVQFIFDLYKADEGILEVAHSIPYSDLASIPKEDLDEPIEKGLSIEVGHSLTELLGSQCDASISPRRDCDVGEESQLNISIVRFSTQDE